MRGFKMLHCGLLLLLLPISQTEATSNRSKRYLIFPRQAPTRHQFIAGIGIPADLDYESLTVGYVLKAEFFLPYNASVYRENAFFPEYAVPQNQRAAKSRSKLRWLLYEYIANRLQGHGYMGQECVLKAICEASHISFALPSIFDELFHILFTPSTSLDDTPDSRNYHEAELLGRTGTYKCEVYMCSMSLLSMISHVLELST